MNQASESFVQFGKSNIEAALTLANITLQSTERLMDIQLKTAKDALDDGMRKAKALSDVKNVQDLVALQTLATQPSLEKALAYSRSLYAVTSDAQARINKVVEACVNEFSSELMTAMDKAAKSAPAGSEAAFAAFKSAFATASSVFDTVTRAARQAGDATATSPSTSASRPAKKKTH